MRKGSCGCELLCVGSCVPREWFVWGGGLCGYIWGQGQPVRFQTCTLALLYSVYLSAELCLASKWPCVTLKSHCQPSLAPSEEAYNR